MKSISFDYGGVTVSADIADGVAVLKASDTASTRQMYLKCLQAGQIHIIYNERTHCLIEKYPGKTEAEIEKLLYFDMQNALKAQFEAKEWAAKQKDGDKDVLDA